MQRDTRVPGRPPTLAFGGLALIVLPLLGGCESRDELAANSVVRDPDPAAPARLSPRPAESAVDREALQVSDAGQEIAESRETAVVRASERVSPAVVAVNVLRTERVRTRDPYWNDFFPFGTFGFGSRTTSRLVPSLGSGFVIGADGVILTNAHVVEGAEQVLVTFPDGRSAEATLTGADETTDVAVLRVEERGLASVKIGQTGDLRIGEWVLALGNPFGNMLSNPEPTVTVGVVSAVGRHIVPSGEGEGFYLGMIQTDAAINPGNSGGPLVNALGEVIGMNASIFSRGGGSEGIGFAIPIERVLRIADDLIAYGEVRRAWLGLEVEPEEADSFGRTRGVLVSATSPDSPAAEAAGESRGTERALAVAPVLDLEPAAGGAGAPAERAGAVELDEAGSGVGGGGAGAGERAVGRRQDFGRVVSLDDFADFVHRPVVFGPQDGRAAGHDDAGARVAARNASDEAAGVGVGLVGDGAGVDHAEVGGFERRGAGAQQLPHALGVVLVRLAAEGLVVDLHGEPPDRYSREMPIEMVPRQKFSSRGRLVRVARSTPRSIQPKGMPSSSTRLKPTPSDHAVSVGSCAAKRKGGAPLRYPTRMGRLRNSCCIARHSIPAPQLILRPLTVPSAKPPAPDQSW